MEKKLFLIVFWVCCSLSSKGQELKTRNLILITLDGLRWQEVFHGADSAILTNKEYVKDNQLAAQFWNSSHELRRELLFPFLWKIAGTEGQLYGNRDYKNDANCANPYWFSYPGYSEIFTGFVDKRVRSNQPFENPNATILEFINKQPGYKNSVAAFATWDLFPYILRENISGIPVSAGKELIPDSATSNDLLNELQNLIQNPQDSHYDVFTFYYALEYLKCKRPRVMFLGLDETDHHAHGGRYDEYLKSAHRSDEMISSLWQWLQSQPDYKDQTTLLITTDHGRGKGSRHAWKNHGRLSSGSSQVWFAVIGPDTPALGEMKIERKYYLKQLAKTSASFLGLDYENVEPVGEIIRSMMAAELISHKY